MEYQRENLLNKSARILKTIVRSYILGTSTYLLSLFTLLVNDGVTLINAVFWFVMISVMIEKFVLLKEEGPYAKSNKILELILRILFIAMNVYAFGINIFK